MVDEEPVDDAAEGGDICWDEVGGEDGEDGDEEEWWDDDAEFILAKGDIAKGNGGAEGGINKFLLESIEDFIAAKAGNADGWGNSPPKGNGGNPAAPAAPIRPKIPLAAIAAALLELQSFCLFFNMSSVRPG